MSRSTSIGIAIGMLTIIARLIAINQPYIDNWSWRESDVAAIARNYFNSGFHFSRPQIDWAGDQPGYIGSEFPLLPFMAAVFYKPLGVHEWIGRAQALVLFAGSLAFFFSLVRDVFGGYAANWALVFYGFAPLSVFTSREFMPDMPSLSLAIVALYFFSRWVGYQSTKLLFISAVAISFAILIKAPRVIIGAPMACLLFQRFRLSALRNPQMWIFAAIALCPAAIWYGYAQHIAAEYYPHHFFGAGGIRIMNFSWYWMIVRQIAFSSLTPILFVLAVGGMLVASSIRRARFLYCWLIVTVLFIIIAGYGNRHQWYHLPLVPVAAAFAGACCQFIGQQSWLPIAARATVTSAIAILFGVSAYFQVIPLYHSPGSSALRDLGLELKAVTPASALIVAADDGDPTVFYYAGRKGWHFLERNGIFAGAPAGSSQAIVDLERLRHRGARYLVFTWATRWWLDYYQPFMQHLEAHSALLKQTPEFSIYRLDPVPE